MHGIKSQNAHTYMRATVITISCTTNFFLPFYINIEPQTYFTISVERLPFFVLIWLRVNVYAVLQWKQTMGTTLQQNCHQMRKQRNERTDTKRMSRKEKATIKTEQKQKQKQQQHKKMSKKHTNLKTLLLSTKPKPTILYCRTQDLSQRLINAIHQYHKISKIIGLHAH